MEKKLKDIFNETTFIYDNKLIIKCSVTSNELNLLIEKFFSTNDIKEVEIKYFVLSIGEKENWNYRLKKIYIDHIEPNKGIPLLNYYYTIYNHLLYNMCIPFNCKLKYSEYVAKKFVGTTINDKYFYCFYDALKELNNYSNEFSKK
jgi:hypothetical protein